MESSISKFYGKKGSSSSLDLNHFRRPAGKEAESTLFQRSGVGGRIHLPLTKCFLAAVCVLNNRSGVHASSSKRQVNTPTKGRIATPLLSGGNLRGAPRISTRRLAPFLAEWASIGRVRWHTWMSDCVSCRMLGGWRRTSAPARIMRMLRASSMKIFSLCDVLYRIGRRESDHVRRVYHW